MSKASSSEATWLEKAAEVAKERATELWNSIPKVGVGHAGAMWRQGWKELRGAFFPESNVAQPTEIGMYGTATQSEVSAERREAARIAPPPADEFSKQRPTVHGPSVTAVSTPPPPSPPSPVPQEPPASLGGHKPSELQTPDSSPTQPVPVEPPTPTFDDRLHHAAAQLDAARTSPDSPSIYAPVPNAPELERE